MRSSAVYAYLLAPELARINAQFAKARDPQRALALDTQWHEQLISRSQNRRLLATIAALRLGLKRYETVYMSDIRLIPESVAQHNAIIHALQEHDIDAAVRSLEDNWRFGMEVLLRKMGEE